ncbi:MAG: nitrile hydratase subunit beta, partial [Betaproteobacteria bacterium]|nr:nitrile hydratase subunit beta [Betaproteobacteria bacterium]
GVVISVSPAYPFPDAHAHGLSADDEPTYDVRFQAEELWPEASEPAMVHVGVFESYLLAIKPCGEPAQAHTPASESLRSAP